MSHIFHLLPPYTSTTNSFSFYTMEDYNKNNNNNNNIDDYASNIITSNINSCLLSSSASSSPPSTPSATANDTAGSRLYRARLILENHLYDELLSRYKLAITRLHELSREATALREENELLRLSNNDLINRLNQVLLVSSEQPYVGPGSGGWSTNSSGDDHPSNVFAGGGNNNSNVGNEFIGSNNSPTSTVINEDDEEEEGDERVSMPKSISVRSPGFFKLLNSPTTVIQSRKSPSQSLVNGTILRVKREEKALEMDVFNQGMYKTELCNKWQETGTCPYGQQCQFAHGLSELRPVIRHPRYKTQVCRMVLAGVTCPYGHRCHFRHSLS